MLIPDNNLAFIAYKTGYCGSLVYVLIAMSPEVAPYRKFNELKFDDGTAHEATEFWMPALHDFNGSIEFIPEKWESILTPKFKLALKSKQLVVVRGHPNTAYKLSFIKNLKVIYVTTQDTYKFERWAYEKVYKKQGEDYYVNDLQRILKSNKMPTVNDTIKRNLLIRNFNHDLKSYEECVAVLKTPPHKLDLDQLLKQNYKTYTGLCDYLGITPIEQDKFTEIIDNYNNKQWKRF
jgi:GTP:adenosylcobinamide-phosphate guanylyltransferase